jgi:protein-tyrosine phosphatase
VEVLLVSVLFVCMGNICRSPIAQGVFEAVIRDEGLESQIFVDSAGTGSWHIGELPDARGRESAKRRGYDLDSQRARRLGPEDCEKFDYIIAMDGDNYRTASALCRSSKTEVRLLLDYAPDSPTREVPDPYYGGPDGFERVLDLVESSMKGLLHDIRERHPSKHV